MADRVEQILQEMVAELDDLVRKRIFSEEEVRQIVSRRRNFEYLLIRPEKRPQDFLNYVRYEIALECLRQRRTKALHWRKRSISDYAGLRRLHFIFSRGIIRFKSDLRFWYQYIDFCLRSGSTKILSRVLGRALKFHPKESHLWLLAADRELRVGHVKATRTLLQRGLRNVPRASALWSEFLKLEVQVGLRMQKKRRLDASGDSSAAGVAGAFAPDASPGDSAMSTVVAPDTAWAPARVLFRRAIARLELRLDNLVSFLKQTLRCLQHAAADGAEAIEEFTEDVHQAIAQRRPQRTDAATDDASSTSDAAVALWELWWCQERSNSQSWRSVACSVVELAPLSVLQRYAATLSSFASDDLAARTALLDLAAAQPSEDPETALVVLEVLERLALQSDSAQVSNAADSAYNLLLRRSHAAMQAGSHAGAIGASGASGASAKLRLLLWQSEPRETRSEPAALLEECTAQTAADAARLLAVAEQSDRSLLGAALRSLAPEESAAPVVAAFLATALAEGKAAFREACDSVVTLAGELWNAPAQRCEALAAVLDAELRVLGAPERLAARFEALLACLRDDDARKARWWVRYVEFVQRAGHGSATDIHWRAMRSVADQAAYAEQVHHLLQAAA